MFLSQNHLMNRTGIILALISAILFGASTPFAKLLLGTVDPWMMAGLLYLGAGFGLAVIHISRAALRIPAVEAPLRRSDIPWLALVVLFGGICGPLLLMFGLARTDAASALGIAWLAFRENVDRRLLVGALAILAGAAVLSWQGGASLGIGGSLIAGACLCWGLDNNLTGKLSSADPVQIAMIKGLMAGSYISQPGARALGRCERFAVGHSSDGGSRRLPRIWRQPRPLRAGTPPSRGGAHRGLFRPGPLRRCRSRHRCAGRACLGQAGRRRRADGPWPISAPRRAA